MGNVNSGFRRAATLALTMLGACAQADPPLVRFDIPAQAAAPALNEFARQADVTLMFSYDSASGATANGLRGRYRVDEGLARLLDGTDLSYTKSGDGTYLVCPPTACRPLAEPVPAQAGPVR